MRYKEKQIKEGIKLHLIETEKFKTKELDDKYAKEAPKQESIDIFTLMRHEKKKEGKSQKDVDVNNLNNTTLKIS